MNSLSKSAVKQKERAMSLDDALEQALTELESGQPLDRDALIARFPEWATDLNEFIDNWLAFERKTGELVLTDSQIRVQTPNQLAGLTVGDHRLHEVIGNGGMGVIYKADQLSLGRTVAVKIIVNPLQDHTRFRVEAEAAASLHHNNIVSTYEVGEIQGYPFISMQYIEGCNLRDRMEAGPLPPNEAARLVEEIARAVHYAHQRGILHRDLKPANVLLDEDSKPFVTDFGLAKQMGNSAELTRSGAVLGTPGYMSPEQAMGQVKSITVAADVYGLGAILFALLVGKAPFSSDSDLKTLRSVIEEAPPRPRSLRPELDRNIETICLKCLEKTPSSRYASARHLADDLSRYLRGEPFHARPISSAGRLWRTCCRNPAIAALSFLSLILLCCTVVFFAGLARIQYYARIDAETATFRQSALHKEVDRARIAAESDRRIAVDSLRAMYASNGLWSSQTDRNDDALLWFIEAARTERGSPSQEVVAKARCLSWFADTPKLLSATRLTNSFDEASFQLDARSMTWRPGGDEIMCTCGDEFVIWNYRTSESWRPSDRGLVARCGAWSATGERFAIGGDDGEVNVFDANSRETFASVTLDNPINFLAFANQQPRIAIASGNQVRLFDPSDEATKEQIIEHSSPVLRASFGVMDGLLLTEAEDDRVRVFDLTTDPIEKLLEVPSYPLNDGTFQQSFTPMFSPDHSKIYVRSRHDLHLGCAIRQIRWAFIARR